MQDQTLSDKGDQMAKKSDTEELNKTFQPMTPHQRGEACKTRQTTGDHSPAEANKDLSYILKISYLHSALTLLLC